MKNNLKNINTGLFLFFALLFYNTNVWANVTNQVSDSNTVSHNSIVLQNDVLQLEINTTGGAPSKVTLKEYQTFSKQPLALFQNDDNIFNIILPVSNINAINTSALSFQPVTKTDTSVTLSAKIETGSINFSYVLHKGSYMVDYYITTQNLNQVVTSNKNTKLVWECKIPTKEKNADYDCRYSDILYKKHKSSSVDNIASISDILTFTHDYKKEVKKPIHWVAYKDHFFSTILIAEDGQPMSSGKFESYRLTKHSSDAYVDHYKANIELAFDASQNQTSKYKYYFGPNRYKELCSYDIKGNNPLHLDKIISTWSVARWISKNLYIPFCNFVYNKTGNIICVLFSFIIILTLLSSCISFSTKTEQCKRKILSSYVNEAVKGVESELERKHITMNIYRSAGFKPSAMKSCLISILYLCLCISFYPLLTSYFELRGKQLFWIDDLSTYDSIYDLGFEITLYGSHVSLLALLMAAIPTIKFIYNLIQIRIYSKSISEKIGFNRKLSVLIAKTFPVIFFFNWINSAVGFIILSTQLISEINGWLINRYVENKEETYKKQFEENRTKNLYNSSQYMSDIIQKMYRGTQNNNITKTGSEHKNENTDKRNKNKRKKH